ncbi:hypothetical protein [Bacillus sp. EAC]|uniref:hypothetical protein n=1 Tax=Bacillus sp. EAC TaxID=1978338 RepID=UPI000B42FC86|nr:hypothetical protein [Bacillus sp. EAC]
MGYIPPLHYSTYHHFAAQKSGFLQAPFMFTKVPKIKFSKNNQEKRFKNAMTIYQSTQINNLIEDFETQKTFSQITGIGRFVNVLI